MNFYQQGNCSGDTVDSLMHNTNDNPKRFIINNKINNKMNFFGLTFVLFILKWSAGKGL